MSEQHAPKLNPRYFLPDRILLYVEHPATEDVKSDKDKLAAQVKAFGKLTEWNGGQQLEPNSNKIITFPGKRANRATSVVPAAVPIGQVEAFVQAVFEDVKLMEEQTVQIAGNNAADEVLLTAVSPVWLMTSASHGISHGGPGGLPVRAENPNRNLHCFAFPSNPDIDTEHPLTTSGQEVTVLILDTAPSEGLIAEWRNRVIEPNDHPLFHSLLMKDGGQLKEVHRDWSAELRATENDYGAGVNVYHMSDHGLFVAGIINSIAPRAELHLYEVLNRFGVGTFDTIAEGLLCALEMRKKDDESGRRRRLIVNCSLMLGAPEPHDGQPATDRPEILRDPEIYRYMNRPFQDIITQLDEAGITVVAAAGNDAHPNEIRPDVRYPAAFDSALAVGALPQGDGSTSGWPPATYSNESNRKTGASGRPAKDGYLTLGGEEGEHKGVLGIYLDTLPVRLIPPEEAHAPGAPVNHTFDHEYEYTKDEDSTGWAWWAGTSFATPIITGLLARTRAQHLNGQNNRTKDEDKLKSLSRNGGQVAPEKVIYAKQG